MTRNVLPYAAAIMIGVVGMSGDVRADWQPPENPNPQQILSEAQAATRAGDHADALARFVWFHEHALKHQPSLAGVRLSFALGYWKDLAQKYPPALEKMQAFRDAARAQVLADAPTLGLKLFESFLDVQSLNIHLGDQPRTVDVFKELDRKFPEAAALLYTVAERSLVGAKEYQLCGKYLDAEAQWRAIEDLYEVNQRLVKSNRFGDPFRETSHQAFINSTATLVALLVVNDEKEAAADVARKAEALVDDAKLKAALKQALAGEVPRPIP